MSAHSISQNGCLEWPPRIFVVVDVYLPGFKSGGPLRTIENMVDRMEGYKFFIFTSDRDYRDDAPYTEIRIEQWNDVGKAKVFYSAGMTMRSIRRQISAVKPDLIYLNSLFSSGTIKVLLMRRAGLLPAIPVVLAPRGECSPGALRLKRLKKHAYLAVAPRLLYRGLIWQATSEFEKVDIEHALGDGPRIRIASDLPPRQIELMPLQKPRKPSGAAKFVYLSRISEKKNLHYFLSLLHTLRGEVELDIWGPIEDASYWRRCQAEIMAMPSSVKVAFRGPVQHERVPRIMESYHFFALPTLGENFGHVVLEAWTGGCPVLISDQTPWVNLEAKRAGWEMPLAEVSLWSVVLQTCVDMDQLTYTTWSESCRRYLSEWMSSPTLEQDNYALFAEALQAAPTRKPRTASAQSGGGSYD
ncbi:MAG: glycosyltransferase [Candidatus Korobacteraceae bacterium]